MIQLKAYALTATRMAATPLNREVVLDQTQKKIYLGDGTSPGGQLVGGMAADMPFSLYEKAGVIKGVNGNIGVQQFYNQQDITKFQVGSSCTTIANQAFQACNYLEYVTIPSSVTTIGNSAFYSCQSLVSLEVPDSVTSIGNGAFGSCPALTTLSLGRNISAIPSTMCFQNTSLEHIAIPDSCISIGGAAFHNCSSLQTITIGKGVSSITTVFIMGCNSLLSITVDPLNASYASPNGVLYDKSLTTLISWPTAKSGACVVSSGVTTIEYAALSRAGGITSVTLPSSLTTIGSSAFSYCSGVSSITLPSAVTSIGSYAFSYCSGMSEFTIPASVTSIGSAAFGYNPAWTHVNCYTTRDVVVDSNCFYGSFGISTLHALSSDITWIAGADTIGGQSLTVIKDL